MSIQSLTSQLTSLDREMHSMSQQLHTIDARLITKRKEETAILEKISREKDLKRLVNHQRDLSRKSEEIARIEKEKSAKVKQIHDKEKKKFDLRQQLGREEQKEREKVKRENQELLKLQQEISLQQRLNLQHVTSSISRRPVPQQQTYDVFLSHAWEDKTFVQPFVKELEEQGLKVWYDTSIMQIGTSLRRAIDKGLANSRFGIVVLSHHFFAKEWPQKELDALFDKESSGGEIILPLWHNISKDEVRAHSSLLADKFALSTAQYGIAELAQRIASVVMNAQSEHSTHTS